MKKLNFAIVVVMLLSRIVFAADDILIKPSLSNVKVFLRGAQLSYFASVKVDKGLNDIVFTGLASNIDRNSINVSAKGDAIIMSVVQRFDYLRIPEKTPQIKMLEDSLDSQNRSLALNQNEIDVLKSEIELILANKNIGNEKVGVSVAELQKMAEFYRKRLSEIKNKMLDLSLISKKIQKNIERIQNQLNELNSQLNKPVNEIVVTVSGKTSGAVDIELSYLIYDAGWQPAYDVRVDKINFPAQLSYKANVWQNSGLDWKNIEIVLSTRNPNVNNNKPELYPWFLDFTRPMVYREMMKAGAVAKSVASDAVMESKNEAQQAETMANYFEVVETQLSVEFTPTIKYSIPSDSKPHSVALQEFSIPAKYEYYAAPKLDNNAFLVARLTDWTNYNLLPGQTNIYFENSYVGQSSINPATTKDTLTLSLGRDQNISISRDVLKDFSEDKFLSSNIERTFAFDIKIKNNKKSAVKIIVEDQIPISKNEDIVVKLIDSSGAVYDQQSGKLKWVVEIEAGKSISKKMVYSVKYPGDKQIQGL
ncbi:MAG: mucoidy inhibitor MuiA family protein [Ignavibacteriales bacterium]|nr:mucoidy inhibitor MuiA family protein [Ignavibacteriales bacterium]